MAAIAMNDDHDARSVISGELDAGERLLWAGRAVQGVRLNRMILLMAPMALATAGLVFYVANDENGPASWAFPTVGLLLGMDLLVMGAVMFGNARGRARTFYGLTDRRVMVVFAPPKTVRSWPLDALESLSVETRDDGSGTVRFGQPDPPVYWPGDNGWTVLTTSLAPEFESVADAAQVHQKILAARQAFAGR